MKLSEIESDKPLTIIVHKEPDDVENDCPNTVTIDPAATLATAAQINPEAWAYLRGRPEFARLLRLVFTEKDFPDLLTSAIELRQRGSGVRHVVGLILLTLDAINSGKRPLVRYPESYLHPAQQTGLADLFGTLSGAARGGG